MKRILIAALLSLPAAPACLTPAGEVDYVATARQLALYRRDILDVLYLADPDTQVRVLELAHRVEEVELALMRADAAGARSSIELALEAADLLIVSLDPDSQLRFYVAAAKIALRHLLVGDPIPDSPPPPSAVIYHGDGSMSVVTVRPFLSE